MTVYNTETDHGDEESNLLSDDVVLSEEEEQQLFEEGKRAAADARVVLEEDDDEEEDDERLGEDGKRGAYITGDYAHVIQADNVFYMPPHEPTVDFEALMRLPTDAWYAECNRRGLNNVLLLAAIAFIPRGPQHEIFAACDKLGLRLGVRDKTANAASVDRRIAEIGAIRGKTASVVSGELISSVVFNEDAFPNRAAEARRHLWTQVEMKSDLAAWLARLGDTNDPEISTRVGYAVGAMIADLSVAADRENWKPAYRDILHVWASRGGHARNALSAALFEITSEERARPILRTRLMLWAASRNDEENLRAALNVCLCRWARHYPKIAMELLRRVSASRHRDFRPKVEGAIIKLWKAASGANANLRRAEIISAELAGQLSDNPRSLFHVLPAIQFAKAVKAELASSKQPPIIYSLLEANVAGPVTKLIKAGSERRASEPHIIQMLRALKRHAKDNGYDG